MPSLRTPDLQEKYTQYRKTVDISSPHSCPLCVDKPIELYVHWKLIRNDFPYNKIAEKHLMLVPLRHVVEADFTPEEVVELRTIKHDILTSPEFDMVIEIDEFYKTIPSHFHLHVIKLRSDI